MAKDEPHPGAGAMGQAGGAAGRDGVGVGASAGSTADAGAARSGEDARRRGWFWHWNTIITQYAPLVGLKGVGLLNSYTVWTDRRDESPHRGYAFPSQQSEADFYGEDRAELIAINKILVALDLIEIRKEMVLRVDEQGRRWRVPHNLYRVKDHRDGYALTAGDVLRVVELAARDRAVYRYIRRIFSPRFAPIGPDNVWHEILPLVRGTDTWQQLAKRANKEEARASARTKAGHLTRTRDDNDRAQTRHEDDRAVDSESADPTAAEGARQTIVEDSNRGSGVGVAPGNTGLEAGADQSNSGLEPLEPTVAGESNEGEPAVVAQSNRMYYQDSSTTTTTTSRSDAWISPPAAPEAGTGSGPLPTPQPTVISCFEAANGRPASPLERELLAELEAAFDASARRAGTTGAEWLIAAIREAVSSGSRFVAPKRIREILTRWSAHAQGDRLRPGAARPEAPAATGAVERSSLPDFPLPHGHGADATWAFTLRLLGASLDADEMARLFAGSRIVAYQAGTVTVAVATGEAAERLNGEYYGLASRKLAEAMRRPVRVEFVVGGPETPSPAPEPRPKASRKRAASAPAREPATIPRVTLPGGLSNLQVWAAAQDDLSRRVTPATWEALIRPSALLGSEPDGTLVLGAPNAFAQRRLSSRLLSDVESVLSVLIGQPARVRVVVAQEWLRGRDQETATDAAATGGLSGTGG